MIKYDVRKDRVLFVDVEMTCWEGAPPDGQVPEIIEIGIAEVSVFDLLLTRSESFLVRPIRSSVSPYCESLTGITSAELKAKGRSLGELSSTIRKRFGSAGKGWMSWGSDRRAIDADCEAIGVTSPFSGSFHDIGFQFGVLVGADRSIGMINAMSMFGISHSGRVHSGKDDAIALANLWIAMASGVRKGLEHSPSLAGMAP